MNEKQVTIICNHCKASREIKLISTPIGDRIDWLEDKAPSNVRIVSARKRLDGEWGFQCLCGENDLLTQQEKETFSNPAVPQPKEISDIVKNLKIQKPKFKVVS